MSDGELLDAREAMSLLGVNETDLQTMVARGSLRAFRSAGTMKFRRDDVLGIKSEKKTDPTIVMPAAAPRNKGGSGILPTVSSTARSNRGSSKNLPAVKTSPKTPIPAPAPVAEQSTSSDQIILEEFELSPSEVDPAANTQSVTASQTAVGGNVTVVDGGVETGNQTVVEEGIDPASATASAIAPVAVPRTESGRQKVPSGRDTAPLAAPAMSRVRAAVSAGSATATARRAQATAAARTAHPIMTFVLVLTAGVYLYTATIVGVQMFKGNYDPDTHQRIIPPFLANAPIINYSSAYSALPGNPRDDEGEYKRPENELGGSK